MGVAAVHDFWHTTYMVEHTYGILLVTYLFFLLSDFKQECGDIVHTKENGSPHSLLTKVQSYS